MEYYQGHSHKIDIREAVEEAVADFREVRPEFILFFSDGKRFAEITRAVHECFPWVLTVGSSTYASFAAGGSCMRGINIIALTGLRVVAGHIDEISRYPMKYKDVVKAAVGQFAGLALREDNTCCLVLNPAGTGSEELVLDTLAEGLKGLPIPVVGGSASSEERVYGEVSLNGEVYVDSSVFVLLHTPKGHMHIAQDNLFQPTNRIFTVTQVDVENRIIYELDGHPVADVLCRCLEVPFSGLEMALKLNPLARIAGEYLFITEIASVNPDGSITTYCPTFNQSDITLLQMGDARQAAIDKLAEIHAALPVLDFSIMVNCFSRTELFLQRGWMEKFTKLMSHSLGNYIGWSSHGEQRGVYHLNWTMLILSFGGTR